MTMHLFCPWLAIWPCSWCHFWKPSDKAKTYVGIAEKKIATGTDKKLLERLSGKSWS